MFAGLSLSAGRRADKVRLTIFTLSLSKDVLFTAKLLVFLIGVWRYNSIYNSKPMGI
jgi:hypothetical protein